ncbi:MAG: hypothetical protein LBU23_04025, partial [Planctomycetota bacterium]|nr:hypothetical protein [Planctomycetota bacterium]
MRPAPPRHVLHCLAALCLGFLLAGPPLRPAWADGQTVTYPGATLIDIATPNGMFGNVLVTPVGSNNNQFTVNDTSSATPPAFVIGGYNLSGASTGNTVTLNYGATVIVDVYGGFASWGGSAMGNTVILNSGAAVGGDVFGGWTHGVGSSSGNTVIVNSGVIVGGSVFGGALDDDSGVTAENNTVILHSGATVVGDVYGGRRLGGGSIVAGNTLELRGSGQSIGGDLAGFEILNFHLPSTLASGGAILTVAGTATISGAAINVGIDGASSPLAANDWVKLINATTLTGTAANTTSKGQGMQGLSLLYEFNIFSDANNLYARVVTDGVWKNPQLKALLEGQAAGAAFVSQGGELAATQGIHGALAAAANAPGGVFTFGAMSGGKSRYNTGSHVDVEGF